jgi:hypothetical protein
MAGYSGSAFKMPELRTKAELLQVGVAVGIARPG